MTAPVTRSDGGARGADRSPSRFPRLGLAGVVLVGVGLVEGLVGALASPDLAEHAGHGGHLLAFIGMVLVVVGLLRDAHAHGNRHRRRADTHAREVPDAVR